MPPRSALTPNSLVAYNLGRARREAGLTQVQAAERLAPFIGSTWSKATWSAAERSIESERVREFSADDIVAFARAFDRPVTWFFLPPPVDEHPQGQLIATPDQSKGWPAGELVDSVLSYEGIGPRLREFFGDEDHEGASDDALSDIQQSSIDGHTQELAWALIRRGLGPAEKVQQKLDDIRDFLEVIRHGIAEAKAEAIASASEQPPAVSPTRPKRRSKPGRKP